MAFVELRGRLREIPAAGFSGGEDEPLTVLIPSKAIRDVSPKTIARVAFVDNRFHLFWLPPPGRSPRLKWLATRSRWAWAVSGLALARS